MDTQLTTRHSLPLRSVVLLLVLAMLTVGFRPAQAGASENQPVPAAQEQESSFDRVEDVLAEDGATPDDEATPRSAKVPAAPKANARRAPVSDANASIRSVDDAVESNRLDATLLAAVDDGEPQTALVIFSELRTDANKARLIANPPGTIKIVERLEQLPVLTVRVSTRDDLLALAQATGVDYVGAAATYQVATKQSTKIIRQPEAAAMGAKGKGTVVAVLDTGVNYLHPDFGNCSGGPGSSGCKVLASYETAASDGSLDDNGHGSNVSAIVLKVAPSAKVVLFDVFYQVKVNGKWSLTTNDNLLLKAVNDTITLKKSGVNIVALNMSLGTPKTFKGPGCDSTKPKLAPALQTAYNNGILPISSAGNSAYETGPFKKGVGTPACMTYSMAVGATYDYNGSYSSSSCYDSATKVDRVTCFSQTGSALSMLATGSKISAGGWKMSGTSQASPHVAGAAAVLAGVNKSARPADIWNALAKTGPAIKDWRTSVTRNRLDLPAAIAAIGGTTVTAPSVTMKATRFKTGSKAWKTGELPVKVDWTASSSNGISYYNVAVSINGAKYVALSHSGTKSEGVWMLAPKSSYQFAVQAVNKSGNTSEWEYTKTVTPKSYGEKNSYVKRSTGWTFYNTSSAYGGRYAYSTTEGAWAEIKFKGRAVAVMAPKWASGKKIEIWINGKYKKTVSLSRSSTAHRFVVASYYWSSVGTRTIRIVVAGASGGPNAAFDGFIILH